MTDDGGSYALTWHLLVEYQFTRVPLTPPIVTRCQTTSVFAYFACVTRSLPTAVSADRMRGA